MSSLSADRAALLQVLKEIWTKRLPSYTNRQPRWVMRVRVAVGIWLLVLAAILLGSGRWWGVVLIAPAALHFYLAFRVRNRVQD